MKHFSKIAYGVIGVAIILLLYVIYILLWPFKTIEATQPFDILTPQVEAGEILSYTAEFKVHTDKSFSVEWELINVAEPNFPITIPTQGRLQFTKGNYTVKRKVIVPIETPPGKYHLRILDKVCLYSFRCIETEFITEDFEVTKSSKTQTVIIRDGRGNIIRTETRTILPPPIFPLVPEPTGSVEVPGIQIKAFDLPLATPALPVCLSLICKE